MFRRIVFTALIILAAAFGCTEFVELVGRDYQDSAKLNFEEGLRFLKKEDYEMAEKYFQLVKNKFSYSKLSKTAELLAADTKFKRDLYSEAIDAYKNFQRKHPNHGCLPYTQYMIAEAYYEQMPEDWWFMPPVYEKDLDLTEKALKEYGRLLDMEVARDYHFDPRFKPEKITVCTERSYMQVRTFVFTSMKKYDFCLRRIVSREIYAAGYYSDREHPKGAVVRIERMFRDYPVTAQNPETVILLARAYEAAHDKDGAVRTWRKLKNEHPEHKAAAEVDGRIAELDELAVKWAADEKADREDKKRKWDSRKNILMTRTREKAAKRLLKENEWEEEQKVVRAKAEEERRRKEEAGEPLNPLPPP